MGFFHLLHTSSLKHLDITTSVLTFVLYPTGLLLGTEGTQFKLGMGRRLEHHFLLSSLLAFLLSLLAALQLPLVLSLCGSVDLLSYLIAGHLLSPVSAHLFSCRKFAPFWYLFAQDSWPCPILTPCCPTLFCNCTAFIFSALYCISNLWL